MIEDLRTVLWKEWKLLFRQRGSRMRALLTLLTPCFFFGIYMPWESAEHWLTRPDSVFAAVALPLVCVLLVIPDSIAGERERHTLPTLLASRLPDGAILLGKAGFAVGLGYGLNLAILVLGWATVNAVHGQGELLLYSWRILAVDLTLSLAVALLTVGVGVLISLRSVTVQEAQQTLAAILILPPTLAGPLVLALSRVRPGWDPGKLFSGLATTGGYLALLGGLALLDALLLAAAKARFQRSRLIAR